MITIILCIIIGLVRTHFYDFWTESADYIISFMFSGIVGLVLAFGIGLFIPKMTFTHQQIELAAMQDGIQTSGQFFLGSGSVDEETYYLFYAKTGETSYVMDKRTTNTSTIFEDEEHEPYLTDYDQVFRTDLWLWIALPTLSRRSEFHIPKGSVLQNFRLDLQ